MINICSECKSVQKLKTDKILNQNIKLMNLNVLKLKICLLLWQLINKIPKFPFFRDFTKECSECNRKYSEIVVDFFIRRKITCKKCKFKVLIYSKLVSHTLNQCERFLKIPKNGFRQILNESISLKKLLLSYLEGISLYGLKIPQTPAGPIITIWSITHRCNLKCVHCYINQNAEINELTFKEGCNLINQLYNSKNFVLGFSGGEPLLREDLFQLIEYASKKGMHIALASNGTLINLEVAKKLKESGVGYVQISIDGLEEIHNYIRGEGTFNKAIQGIKNCIKFGLYVSMDIVVTKLNISQIYELFELARSLNVQEFEILDFVPSGNGSYNSNITLTPLEIEKLAIIICGVWQQSIENNYPITISYKNPIFSRILIQKFNRVNLMPFFKGIFPKDALKAFNFSNRLLKGVYGEQTPFSPFVTGCEAGTYVIHVKPDGNITPCPLNLTILGNSKKEYIQEIWKNSTILNQYRKLKHKGRCGRCVYKIICGGCRAKTYIRYGSHNLSDPTCLLNFRKNKSIF